MFIKTIFCLLSFCAGYQIFSQCYWQQRVEYDMGIHFDVKNHQFQGNQRLNYYNNSPDTLFNVFFHLYFNAFQPGSMMDVRSRTIEDPDSRVMDRIAHLEASDIGFQKIISLQQNGYDLAFHVEGTVLEVPLHAPIPPNSRTTFTMTFHGQVPVQIRRSGRNNAEGISYSMAQWFPKMAEYDERGWHAHPYIGREFYAPWGDYNVTIRMDKSYVIAATGVLQNPNEVGHGYAHKGVEVKQKGDKLTWHFKAENVHDFVWAADPDYKHVITSVPEGPMLHFFYQETEDTGEWKILPEITLRAFQFIEKNFGKYPYPHYSIIQGGDGGMEYPMATLITGHRSLISLVNVTVHEILHSWYQGLLATNESYYAWMDEGFTSYATSLTMAHLFGTTVHWPENGSYQGYYALATSGKEEPMSTHSDQFETNFAYGNAAYSKGAVSIAQLGYIIGDKPRDEGLLTYFHEWNFKHPDMNDFVRVMEKRSGLELDWYYDYWVNSTHTIDYGIDSVYSNERKTYVTLERIGAIPMPMDIYVGYKDGTRELFYAPLTIMRGEKEQESVVKRTVLPDWPWTHPTYSFAIPRPLSEIQSIEIDETGRMADVYTDNNKWMNE